MNPMNPLMQIDDVGLPIWVFLVAGASATLLSCLVLGWKGRAWWPPLFYYPAVALIVSLLASFEMVRPFGWDRPASNLLALVVLYMLALVPLLFLKKTTKSEAEIKAEMARADRVLVTALLVRGRDEDSTKAEDYIRGSDLTPSEKKRALEMLRLQKAERLEEIKKNLLK